MKTFLIILLAFVLNINLHAQRMLLEFNDECKFESTAIRDIEKKTASEIYNLTEEWVSYTFMNTDEVSQSNIKNKMIRFKGESPGVVDGPLNIRYGLGYYIQIDIKDNKIRMRVFNMYSIGVDAAQTKVSLETALCKMFKPCELMKGKLYSGMQSSTEEHLNKILEDYINFLNKGETQSLDEW